MTRYHAKGTTISLGGTDVGQVFGIAGPSTQAETVDVTDHDTTTLYREFLGSLIDGGEVTLEIHYDPMLASHRAARAILDSGLETAVVLTFTDTASTQATFQALVTQAEPNAPVDDKLSMTLGLKVSGAVKGLGGES